MPITLDQFTKQFEKLQASQGITKSPKILDRWFEEFQDLEYFPFVNAMKRLQYGEKFPNWDMFKSQYRNCIGVQKPIKRIGCKHCCGGWVYYRDYDTKANKVTDYAANCVLCSPGKSSDMKDINPHNLVKDESGQLITEKALGLLPDGVS